MSKFQASRLHAAIENLDGSPESDAALDFVLASCPWHEVEVELAATDDLRDAVTLALSRFVGTMH